MKPNEKNKAPDSQIERVAARLRNEGVNPGRDLWPAIEQEIDRRSANRVVRGPVGLLRPLAVAAVMLLLVFSGGVMVRQMSRSTMAPAVLVGADGDGLAVIDQALDEIHLALAADPDNRNLSQLALMMHKKRGNLLRRDFANRVL